MEYILHRLSASAKKLSDTNAEVPRGQRDPWVSLGIAVSATSAAVSSFSGLYSLSLATGWHPWIAPLYPLTIDAWALTATRVWLAVSITSPQARRFARRCAVTAILFSVGGNAVWHLLAAHGIAMSWVIVLAVGAMPPAVLGLIAHLAALRKQDVTRVPQSVLDTPADVVPRTQYRTDDELLEAARTADAAWRAAHHKPISRDALRRELKVSAARATELLRRIKAERQRGDPDVDM
jgi:uncharacterized protein DUF2637